jgi:hypothetical protein
MISLRGPISKKYTHCHYCEVPFGEYRIRTRDHFVPLSRSGAHKAGNLYIVCEYCNGAKGNLLPNEFIYLISQKIKHNESLKAHTAVYDKQILAIIYKNIKEIYDKSFLKSDAKNEIKKKVITIVPKQYPRKLSDLSADCHLSVNVNTSRQTREEKLFLQSQTVEEFRLIKKHGPIVGRQLAAPEPNFHYED